MFRFHFIAVLLLGVGCGALAALPTPAAAPAPTTDKVAKLIEQLGSSKFEEREQASKDFEALGLPALEALRKAGKSDDAEVSRRATDLVKIIEKRSETLLALKPTMVHLVFKDTPLTDAVAEIKKQTGYSIALHDPENKLKERTITLDTGETTFWQAFDQFCEKAGIHEAGPQEQSVQPLIAPPGGARRLQQVPPADPRPAQEPKPPVEKKVQPSAAFAADDPPPQPPRAAKPAPPVEPLPPVAAVPPGQPVAGGRARPAAAQITLTDGKVDALATDYAGAIRIRAVTKTDKLFPAAVEGEILLALQITPEPKITWQFLTGVKIDKATDDQDQKLGDADPANAPGLIGPNRLPGPLALPLWKAAGGGDASIYVAVRLKKGDKASKALKELTGSIAAQVLPEPKTLISTDEIMKSAGKTFKGDDGGAIKVVSVDKDEKTGEVKAVFEFQAPAGFPAAGVGGFNGPAGPAAPVPVQIRLVPVPLPPPPPPPVPPPADGQLPAAACDGGVAQPPQAAQPAQPQAAPAIQIQIGNGGGFAPRPGFGFSGNNGLKLVDDRGHAVEGHTISVDLKAAQPGAPIAHPYVLTFTLKKDQTEGGKLTYSASKAVTVDVPFKLKDVVLP